MRLIKYAAMAASATALDTQFEEFEHPTVEASTYFPRYGWGVVDWTFGLVAGSYAPLQVAWRDNDCRSQWLNMGLRILPYSEYFDQPFDVSDWHVWFNMVLSLTNTGISLYHLIDVCAAQYLDLGNDPWYLNFNLLSDDMPIVEASAMDTVETVLTCISIVLDGYAIYTTGKTEYYYLAFGAKIGLFVSHLFVAIDNWTGSTVIPGEKPWVAYDNQAP